MSDKFNSLSSIKSIKIKYVIEENKLLINFRGEVFSYITEIISLVMSIIELIMFKNGRKSV